jgi:hypothetical protein
MMAGLKPRTLRKKETKKNSRSSISMMKEKVMRNSRSSMLAQVKKMTRYSTLMISVTEMTTCSLNQRHSRRKPRVETTCKSSRQENMI